MPSIPKEDDVSIGVVQTAKFKIGLKDVHGELPNKHNKWGWFSADLHFEGEKVGTVCHNTAGTEIKCECEKRLDDFADRFPPLPPHSCETDAKMIIRLMAFQKLRNQQ